jgi:GNAT superfamily N-acetyltransferase
MNISTITKNELPALANLYQQLIPNDISVAKMEAVLNKHKENPNHIVLSAKIDGQLVGSLLAVVCNMLFGQCKSFMVVEDVVVDEAYRRNGVGAALMQYIEDYARKNNCSYIMLITDTDRVGSQQFYKSLGYMTDEYCAFKKQL